MLGGVDIVPNSINFAHYMGTPCTIRFYISSLVSCSLSRAPFGLTFDEILTRSPEFKCLYIIQLCFFCLCVLYANILSVCAAYRNSCVSTSDVPCVVRLAVLVFLRCPWSPVNPSASSSYSLSQRSSKIVFQLLWSVCVVLCVCSAVCVYL